MTTVLATSLAFAFSQIMLSAFLLIRQRRKWSLQEWLLFLFLTSVAAYLAHPMARELSNVDWLTSILRVWENTLPGLFWLFCASLFNDGFKLKPWNISVVAFTVIMPFIGNESALFGVDTPRWLFLSIPQLVEFVLIGLALFSVVQSWQDDLIETRRDLRFWFCSLAGVYIFIIILFREILFRDAAWLTSWQYVPLGLICMTTNLLLLQYRPGLVYLEQSSEFADSDGDDVSLEQAAQPQPEKIKVPEKVISQLDTLMNEERIYREMGLTIGQVAEKLELPEYRLRKMINAGLGYRNFNDYLNGFRIKEAGELLSDPKQANEAILNIALDTGFRSLSSFNKAFREAYGKTPTAYRKEYFSENN